MRWPISRVLSRTIIHLGQTSPFASSNLPKNDTGHICVQAHCSSIWSCSRWGLPCHKLLPVMRCALTAPFHPYRSFENERRSIFCCTCRRLTPPRSYLAPCPLEPGLSSLLANAKARLSGHLKALIIREKAYVCLSFNARS